MIGDSLTYNVDSLYVDSLLNPVYGNDPALDPRHSVFEMADSLGLYPPENLREYNYLPREIQTYDWIFGFLLIIYVLFARTIGRKIRLFPAFFKDFMHYKERGSLFSEPLESEWYENVFMSIQTCFILSVFISKLFSSLFENIYEFPEKTFLFIGISTGILLILLIYKLLSYRLVGSIFFEKGMVGKWTNNFISLFGYSGLLLFLPVICYIYVRPIEIYCLYFILFYLALVFLLIVYKAFVLFFHKVNTFLYLFLYLCTQEIIPLFLAWKLMVYMFNLVLKSTLWL